MTFPQDFYQYLHEHTLVGIKGGLERETFLDIWMVQVEGRVFARSWSKSERSWFTEIVKTGVGQIRYGDRVIPIRGEQLSPQAEIHAQINQRYLSKYNQEGNRTYAEGITQDAYKDYTLECWFHDSSLTAS